MTRYAIYAVPGALGAHDDVAAVSLRAAAETWYARQDFSELTVSARRYGFHATLKAPFRLAAGHTEAELQDALSRFAAARTELVIPALSPRPLGAFRAMLPTGDLRGINALAEETVREFDHFRAPLSREDIARRRPAELSLRQRELFWQWGYPYVYDEFRFHLTLTDALPPHRAHEVDAALADHFADVTGQDVALRSVVIAVEPDSGEFTPVESTPGESAPAGSSSAESIPAAPFEILSVHPFAPTITT